MEPKDRIAVLLAEYNTLRAEVVAARTTVWQAIVTAVPVLMGLVGLSYSTTFDVPKGVVWAVVCSTAVFLLLIYLWNDINTRRFTRRLRLLETRVNSIANEQLLTWETTQGWGSIASRTNDQLTSPPQSN